MTWSSTQVAERHSAKTLLPRLRHGLARRTIFISYRRTDSGGHAGHLRQVLQRHYGSRALFLDHQDTRAGEHWEQRLEAALEAADVVLVVIGPDWVTIRDEDGTRRLDNPDDWVRREVEAGLAKPSTDVIPILVGGTHMPSRDELPASLSGLCGRQAHQVRPDTFSADANKLIRSIGGWRSQFVGVPLIVWPSIFVVLALLSVGIVALVRRDANRPPDLPDALEFETGAGRPVEINLLGGVSDEGSVDLGAVDPVSGQGGAIKPLEGGVVEYTPAAGFHGPDTFDYQVTDEAGAISSATVLVRVRIGPMVGDFNVAVVPFTEVMTDGSIAVTAESRGLAAEIHSQVDQELTTLNEVESFNFEVRGPHDASGIEGASHEERARQAQELAEHIAADVIVYGTMTDDEIAPEFFVHSRGQNLAGAEEMAGQYELGDRILGSELQTGSITDKAAARRALSARANALTHFVIGLSYYGGRDYTEALQAFELADIEEWGDEDGKEILYLFLGNSEGQLGERALEAGNHDTALTLFEQAAANYDESLARNPEFARALLGRAEIEYFRAAVIGQETPCSAGAVSADGLAQAEASYLDARSAVDQPAVSNVAAKASFGLGRLYVCVTLAGIADRSTEARTELAKVIEEFEHGNRAIEELATKSLEVLEQLS